MALHGATIAIIGGSSGIGLATAIAGQKAGAKLVLGGRSKVRLDKAREQVGGGTAAYSVDSNSEESLHNFFERCGPIDHLFVTRAAR